MSTRGPRRVSVDPRKPVVLTWRELEEICRPLHMNVKADVDRLHDIWKTGAVSPDSRVMLARDYDPRKKQPGAYEARLVLPTQIRRWIEDTAARRGISFEVAFGKLCGSLDS